jgi:hypothetical protein
VFKSIVLAMSVGAAVTLPAQAFEAKPFTASPRCTEILGPDLEAGLKNRLLEVLEAANWFEGDRSYLRSNLFNMLLMLPLSEQEIRQVIAKGPEANLFGFWQVKLAEAAGDWSLVYDPKVVNYNTDFIGIAAGREALADARAGRPIAALKRFREHRADAIAAANSDTTRKLLEDPNMDSFIAVGILRRLILERLDDQARAFTNDAGIAGLDLWLTAMIDGRAGGKSVLARMAAQPGAGTLSPPSDLSVGTTISPLGEFMFQAIAANRTELRGDLRALAGAPEMRQAGNLLPLLIERRDVKAMAFAYTLTKPERRTVNGDGSILVDLAERADADALMSLDADTKQATPGFPVEADRYNLRNALVYALVRAGRSEEALKIAGDLTLYDLGTEWTYVEGTPVAEPLSLGAGEGILPAIVLFADESQWPTWRKKLDEKQNYAFDFLVETHMSGSDAAERLLNEHPERQLFGDDPWRHIGYFQLTSAFYSTNPKRFENWYRSILGDPVGNYNFMDEWFWLVRERCLGWAYEPLGPIEAGVADYTRRGSVFAGGVGGMILLTSK